MRGASHSETQDGLPESQRTALISLLSDEDPAIYTQVRTKLLAYGDRACEWLRPYLVHTDPVLRRRAREIVLTLGRRNGHEHFIEFCLKHGEEFDLEEGVGLLAQTQYPDVKWTAYQALFDQWAEELRERTAPLPDREHHLAVLNDYLFEVLGFQPDPDFGVHPEASYLNRVVDLRTGNPISLCTLYLFLGRRLGLPLTGIGMPGHFICRYQTPTKEIYIDVYRHGTFWSKADCIRRLVRARYTLRDGYLTPMSSRRTLLRMCANLHLTYCTLEMSDEAERVQKYIVALAR